MSKKHYKRNKKLPPNYRSYFQRGSEKALYSKYHRKYVFAVIAAIIAEFLPVFIFGIFLVPFARDKIIEVFLMFIGFIGCLSIGIGFCNLIAISIEQYLGDKVTLYAFLIGVVITSISGVLVYLIK